jgi:predicted phage terminase large subunit-like protein
LFDYPELRSLILSHAREFAASNVLIEDKASGTQLIQELKREGFHQITRHAAPAVEKEIRLRNVSPSIENGFVY